MSDVLAAHYMAGIVGVALVRHWYEPGADNVGRMQEFKQILDHIDEFPQNLALNPTEHSVADGYRDWSAIYDGANPMIEQEESVTVPWLSDAVSAAAAAGSAPVRALDGGCGTGRQAKMLSELGAEVVGVDATQEMLDIAADKVPNASFQTGSLDELPCDDDAFDLAVASLAICHLDEPGPAIGELARCVRSGGSIIISEPHPTVSALGGQAFYGGFEGGMNFVRNNYHSFSSWTQAFVEAGVQIEECIELAYNADVLKQNPLMPVIGDALTVGFNGLPFILCFRLRVS